MPEALPEGPTEDISGRRPGRPIPSSTISFVIKAPHETMHLALVTIVVIITMTIMIVVLL